MRLHIFIPALVIAWLALGTTVARADHYDFTVSPNPPNQGQVTTFTLQGSTDDVERIRWDLDGDGDFDSAEEDKVTVTHVYGATGPVAVRMRVDEDGGGPNHTAIKTITVNGPPTVDFDFTPASPVAGQPVSFTPTVSDPESDGVTLQWAFGDGRTSGESSPTVSYAEPGPYTVTLTATDEHGATSFAGKTVTVDDGPGPAAGFEYSPGSPFTGDLVTFTSTSTPGQGEITDLEWDLDDDGEFDDATGPEATWTYSSAGSHLVLLRATQTGGKRSVAFKSVEVAQRPPAPPPPGTGSPTGGGQVTDPVIPEQPRLLRMRPFPVVRIAGVVLPTGADVEILSVRAPRGARVRVRCRGRGCPVASIARTAAARTVRFRRFERRLRAGIRLTVLVRQEGRIGKYTRFLIRAGKAPARVDRCLVPGRRLPVRCP